MKFLYAVLCTLLAFQAACSAPPKNGEPRREELQPEYEEELELLREEAPPYYERDEVTLGGDETSPVVATPLPIPKTAGAPVTLPSVLPGYGPSREVMSPDEGLEDTSSYTTVYNSLTQGVVQFPERVYAQQGESFVLEVSVAREALHFEPLETSVVKPLRISELMCAQLLTVDPLRITPLADECQIVSASVTQWQWAVFPEKSGEHEVRLKISNKIKIEGSDEYHTELSREALIHVKVSVWYAITAFFATYFKEIGALLAFCYGTRFWVAWRKKVKQRGAG